MRRLKHKGAKGSKTLSRADVRELFATHSFTTALGVVRKFEGESSHYEIDGGEVLVDVELVPNGEKVLCRLGFGGRGVYSIPAVGSEVAVIIPASPRSLVADDLDNDPIIVAVLENAPSQLDGDDIVVVKSARVVIIADAAVEVGAAGLGANDGVVHGAGIDPFTGQTYTALQSTSARLKAKKL